MTGGKSNGQLWGLTTYFNPAGYRRRLENYRVFRKHFQAPLLTVELSFDGQFELCDEDADSLIRITGGDVMWQKERLLNLALQSLPPTCREVAWVDCDVVLEDDGWPEKTSRLLEHFTIVQPFSFAYRMPPEWRPGDAISGGEEWYSIPFLIQSGKSVEACVDFHASKINACHGYAWAVRREFITTHRFYDACVIGGGDSVLLRAAYGHMSEAPRFQKMNARQRDHYDAWAHPFYAAARASVGAIPGRLFHLWHGQVANRRYTLRFSDFEPFDFDPFTDIAVYNTGVWRWNSDKPDMHDHIRRYFAQRREDE
jgi:hypothetical protein